MNRSRRRSAKPEQSSPDDWVIGVHAVEQLLRSRPAAIRELRTQDGEFAGRHGKIKALATQQGLSLVSVERGWFDRFQAAHQGVAARVDASKAVLDEQELLALTAARLAVARPLLLVLDGVTDPHNFGACLRTADAAGVDAVIVPRDNAAPLNATVRKVACGAAETVPVAQVTNLARCLERLKEQGIWLLGTADGAAQDLFQHELSGPLAIVMGSEGRGLRRLTRELCDFEAAIPMAGDLSSLNVSVATGVTLFEVVRQRRLQG